MLFDKVTSLVYVLGQVQPQALPDLDVIRDRRAVLAELALVVARRHEVVGVRFVVARELCEDTSTTNQHVSQRGR